MLRSATPRSPGRATGAILRSLESARAASVVRPFTTSNVVRFVSFTSYYQHESLQLILF